MSTRRQPQPVYRRGFDRLNALSDGVVAIAITLLVFSITDLAASSHGADVLTIVDTHRGTFITFLITFLVIAKLWVDNHRLYRDVAAYTTPLMWIHMGWLLSIVFIPFPMDVLASADDTVFPNSAAYVGTLLVAVAALFAEYVIVVRSVEVQEEHVNLRPGLISAGADTLCVVAAFVLTLTIPSWGLLPLLLLIVGGFGGRVLSRRCGGRSDA